MLYLMDMEEILTQEFKPDGFNIGKNINSAGGQKMMHANIRYFGDPKKTKTDMRQVL
jgi:diadenosine tetraphosphate (Ap4A) HIT family hydrolase